MKSNQCASWSTRDVHRQPFREGTKAKSWWGQRLHRRLISENVFCNRRISQFSHLGVWFNANLDFMHPNRTVTIQMRHCAGDKKCTVSAAKCNNIVCRPNWPPKHVLHIWGWNCVGLLFVTCTFTYRSYMYFHWAGEAHTCSWIQSGKKGSEEEREERKGKRREVRRKERVGQEGKVAVDLCVCGVVSCVDCTCLTVSSSRHADYAGHFHRHSTSTFNDRHYYIRAPRQHSAAVTSSLRDCDMFLYAFAEVPRDVWRHSHLSTLH